MKMPTVQLALLPPLPVLLQNPFFTGMLLETTSRLYINTVHQISLILLDQESNRSTKDLCDVWTCICFKILSFALLWWAPSRTLFSATNAWTTTGRQWANLTGNSIKQRRSKQCKLFVLMVTSVFSKNCKTFSLVRWCCKLWQHYARDLWDYLQLD